MANSEMGPVYSPQAEKLVGSDLSAVLHGCEVPESLIVQLLPASEDEWRLVVDMGAGDGRKAEQLARLPGYAVFPRDINVNAVRECLRKGLIGSGFGDVTRFESWPLGPGSVPFFLEGMDAVLMEGLLCNLAGPEIDWKRAVRVAHMHTSPSRYLFIADVLRADEENPVLREVLGEAKFGSWRNQWNGRYKANNEAGLGYGEFVVANPGNANFLAWGGPKDIKSLIASKRHFQRYARHFTVDEITREVEQVGFRVKGFDYAVWKTKPWAYLSIIRGIKDKVLRRLFRPQNRILLRVVILIRIIKPY